MKLKNCKWNRETGEAGTKEKGGMEEHFTKYGYVISNSDIVFNKEKIELVSPVAIRRRVLLESFMAEVAFERGGIYPFYGSTASK